MNYLKSFLALYGPGFPATIVYMLQSVEYQVGPYLQWFWRTQDFSRVSTRRSLEQTRSARLLLVGLRAGIAAYLLGGVFVVLLGVTGQLNGGVLFGAAMIVAYPTVWAHLVVVPLALGKLLISGPRERASIKASEAIFANHPGVRIAVAGSYGKTTMKELLATVLAEGLDVAATPANKNVAISHARFAEGLSGKEDVLVIEYGEGEPGDVARFARTTHPTHGIITGLAPAHLDHYKTLQAAGKDIFSLADYLEGKQVYVNTDTAAMDPFLKDAYQTFDKNGALGWSVGAVKQSFHGTEFTLNKGEVSLHLKTGLLGMHQVGVLAFVAALGMDLGLTKAQVEAGVAKTAPFAHRMQPYQLGGAWIIDDTYNGNIEGVRAGTELLAALPGERKMYVTPGLVEQGIETRAVHERMGGYIAAAHPQVVVLMHNSVTEHIVRGLTAGGFDGEVRIERDPLAFYTNLDQFVAAGDVVLMQNDWTDNYA